LTEPYKVRLDINLGVPDETMFTKPLSGPGCQPVLLSKDHTSQTIYNIPMKENPLMGLGHHIYLLQQP